MSELHCTEKAGWHAAFSVQVIFSCTRHSSSLELKCLHCGSYFVLSETECEVFALRIPLAPLDTHFVVWPKQHSSTQPRLYLFQIPLLLWVYVFNGLSPAIVPLIFGDGSYHLLLFILYISKVEQIYAFFSRSIASDLGLWRVIVWVFPWFLFYQNFSESFSLQLLSITICVIHPGTRETTIG